MNRRQFMKRFAGIGALIAVSDLPTLAEDNPSVFSERGNYEKLAISYDIVRIGATRPFSILHISDTHLTSAYSHENSKKQELMINRTKTFGGRQEEALKDTLIWAKDNVDYVLHTGDLIDWQSEANFDLVRKYFGDKNLGVVGNHEFSPDMWLSDIKESRDEKFKDLTREEINKVYPFDISFQSQIINGVNFITLDDVYGYVTSEQVSKFQQELRKGYPIVLCMHVPFFSEDLWLATYKYWKCYGKRFTDASLPPLSNDYTIQKEDTITRDFIASLKKEPLLKAILAGHQHIGYQEQFSPWARQYIVGANFMFQGHEVLFI